MSSEVCAILYLSDGGYTRLIPHFFHESGKPQLDIDPTGANRQKVMEQWDSIEPLRILIEELMNDALQELIKEEENQP